MTLKQTKLNETKNHLSKLFYFIYVLECNILTAKVKSCHFALFEQRKGNDDPVIYIIMLNELTS